MDLITKDSEITLVLFSSFDRVLENVEYMVMNYRPVLNGEHYLTGEEVCKRLCISKRTLQDYRDTGLLGYVQLPASAPLLSSSCRWITCSVAPKAMIWRRI